MGKGETSSGDSFDLWKQRLQCLWSDGAAWDICPALAFPTLWSATCALSHQLALVGFPQKSQ